MVSNSRDSVPPIKGNYLRVLNVFVLFCFSDFAQDEMIVQGAGDQTRESGPGHDLL